MLAVKTLFSVSRCALDRVVEGCHTFVVGRELQVTRDMILSGALGLLAKVLPRLTGEGSKHLLAIWFCRDADHVSYVCPL